jgi:hypothetical protein
MSKDFFANAKEQVALMEKAVELKVSIMKEEYLNLLKEIAQFDELPEDMKKIIIKEIKIKTGRDDYQKVLEETFKSTKIFASIFPK